jgi:hypothetical protein
VTEQLRDWPDEGTAFETVFERRVLTVVLFQMWLHRRLNLVLSLLALTLAFATLIFVCVLLEVFPGGPTYGDLSPFWTLSLGLLLALYTMIVYLAMQLRTLHTAYLNARTRTTVDGRALIGELDGVRSVTPWESITLVADLKDAWVVKMARQERFLFKEDFRKAGLLLLVDQKLKAR